MQVGGLTRPGGGQSNDTILFAAEWRERGLTARETLVLRREQTGHHIFRDPDVLREFRVLSGSRVVWVPVPQVRWAEADPSVLGAPFFVMHAVAGHVLLARPSIHSHGWLPSLTTSERERLWNSALDALVAIHAVDWTANHSFLLDGDPAGVSAASQLDRIADWYRWATAGREYPITDAALERLVHRRATIATVSPTLVWGDARVGNMIFGSDHRVAAVIDWELRVDRTARSRRRPLAVLRPLRHRRGRRRTAPRLARSAPRPSPATRNVRVAPSVTSSGSRCWRSS